MSKPKVFPSDAKILIVQTAFIGDVVLAAGLVDRVQRLFSGVEIHFLVRRGNESLLATHPLVARVWVWDKGGSKYRSLFALIGKLRQERFDIILNLQRYFNSGLITCLSAAVVKIGFKSNPLSIFFSQKVPHRIPYAADAGNLHEVQRNALLLATLTDGFEIPPARVLRPRLHLTPEERARSVELTRCDGDYLVLAPGSVWFTKQMPVKQWRDLTVRLARDYTLLFIGSPSEKSLIDGIIADTPRCRNFAGHLSLRESAALMAKARRVITHDSAPLHLASAVNAPTTAVFCSTIPEFGYGPLADDAAIVQVNPRLSCIPCGVHGKRRCPLDHFHCGHRIRVENILETIG